MADGYKIDLRKLGEKLPDGVQRAGRVLGKAAEKPLAVAHELAYPFDWLDDRAQVLFHPLVASRLKGCTIETRGHVEGMADLPALVVGGGTTGSPDLVPVTLFRLRVERPDGDAEMCVRQVLPAAFVKLVPGSSLRVWAHESESRFAFIDWRRSAELAGMELSAWSPELQPEQYDWPEEGWPAKGGIEIRDEPRLARRLDERRAAWRSATGRLVEASRSLGAPVEDGRDVWKLGLEVEGRSVELEERVPRLLVGRAVGVRRSRSRLGGVVEEYELVVDDQIPVPLLVSRSGEMCIDWQALIDRPEMTATG